ncbi:MAG: CHAP domain-containing protein [Eubacteriales bacterium]|nr:CHAP domain-containing protein [Eubacteriales bacterium]
MNNTTKKIGGSKANWLRWLFSQKSFLVFAAVVVFITTYMLILPALTQSTEVYCGMEEHQHEEACYTAEKILSCTIPEAEAHTHEESCYDENGELICEREETEGHSHTDECYTEEQKLVCGKEEHVHTLSCYSDPNADLETEAGWSNTFAGAALTGNRADDVIAIAETQIGYTESENNYRVAEGDTRQGYTRYGAWYGDPYGEWDAMFVSFCLNYAHIGQDVIPYDANCMNWIGSLSNNSLYHSAADAASGAYAVKKGDLVFFDLNGDGIADHVGLVKAADGQNFTVIEGNINNSVASGSYAVGGSVMGFGELPVNAAADTADSTDTADTEEDAGVEEADTEEEPFMSAQGAVTVNGITYNPFPKVTASGSGTKYNPATGAYDTSLKIDFSMKKEEARGKYFVCNYPEGVIVPDGELKTHDLYDGNTKAGTYTFIKNTDGTYSVLVAFDDTYMSNAGETVTGFVKFDGSLDGSKQNSQGEIEFHGDGYDIKIPKNEITYPEDSTKNYDVSVAKNGSYISADNTLKYTVDVMSKKGTKDIKFEDMLTASGISFGAPTNVKIEKITANYYDWGCDTNNQSGVKTEIQLPNDYSYNNGKISMTLPPLTSKTEKAADGAIQGERYRITYTYPLAEGDLEKAIVNNKVEVRSEDTGTGEVVHKGTDKSISFNQTTTMNKGGWYDSDNGRIRWTLNVNNDGMDLVGATIRDKMFADMIGDTLEGIDTSDYEFIEENGKRTGIRFLAPAGSKKYEIKYYTPVVITSSDDIKVTNEAILKTKDGKETKAPAEVTIKGNSPWKTRGDVVQDGDKAIVKWTAGYDVPSGKIPAGTVLSDNMMESGDNSKKPLRQYMTKAQILEWKNAVQWSDGTKIDVADTQNFEVTFLGSDGQSYSLAQIAGQSNDLTYTQFSIKFKNELQVPANIKETNNKKLSFTYSTTADLSEAKNGSNYYCNTIHEGEKKSTVDYTYIKSYVEKTNGKGETGTTKETSAGDLVWIVNVGSGDSDDFIKVTDTLPKGVSLKGLSVKRDQQSGELKINDNGDISETVVQHKFTGHYNSGTGVVELEIRYENGGKVAGGTKFEIRYDCEVEDEVISNIQKNEDGSYSFANSVVAENQAGVIGDDSQEQDWTRLDKPVKDVSKSGTWDNDNQILHYSISINPNAEDWMQGSDTLTFKDVLSYQYEEWWCDYRQISIMPNTVKLYYAATNGDGTVQVDKNGELVPGREVTNWSWTYDEVIKQEWNPTSTCTIEGTIPDETPLVLQYSYRVHFENPTQGEGQPIGGVTNEGLGKIGNKIHIVGPDKSDENINTEDKWHKSGSSGGVTTEKNYTFYKVEQGNYGVLLDGAIFEMSTTTDGNTWTSTGKTYTTEKGHFTITWDPQIFEYNKLYKIKEIQAPEGYELPANVPEYTFYFSNENDKTNTLPWNKPASAVDITKRSETAYVQNEKNYTDINVNKQWFDPEGNDITKDTSESKISFDLYQVEVAEDGTEGTPNVLGTYDITKKDDWKWSSSDTRKLPKKAVRDGRTYTYKYYVKEKEVTNYTTTYKAVNGTEAQEKCNAITEGSITIINKQNEKKSFVLPHTGGSGTRPFVWSGAALIILALGFGFIYRRRCERRLKC